MSRKQPQNPLLKQIQLACKNTSVSAREVLKELSLDDINMLKSGDLSTDYLVSLAQDLHEEKKLFSTVHDDLGDSNRYDPTQHDDSSHL